MGESLVKVPGVEDKMAGSVTPNGALEVSISFGRFENDSLSWEKWSTFSPNKYLEEVEKCSTPGSVAQKKAYFEAHYKKIAARKAELLEQENMMGTDSSRSNEMNCSNHSTSTSGTDAERGTLNGHGSVEEVDLDTNSLSEVSSGFVNESEEGDVHASECLSSLVESIVEEVPEKLQSEEVKCPEKADLVTEDILKISEEVQDTEGKPLKMDSEMINAVKANEKRSEFNAHLTAQKVPQTKKEENLANTMKKKPVLPTAKSSELSTPKTRRSSKPVLSSTPRSSKPVLSSTPISSKVVSTSTTKLSKPVSASTPRSTKPVSASIPRSSKPESAATPKLSKPVFTSSPTLSKAVSTSAPRLSRPAPASTSRLSKPISTSIVRPVSHSSTRKPNVLPSQKSKDSSATTIKLAAPTSLHKSVDSVSITTNKKSLIMEQMGDTEIIKRAFKSFQSNLNQLQPSRVDKPHGPRPVSARGSEHQVSGFVTSRKENDRTRKITAHRLPSGTDWSTTSSSRSLIETGARIYKKTDSSSGGPKIDERAEKRKAFFKNLEEKSNARDEEKRHHNSKSKETVKTSIGHA